MAAKKSKLRTSYAKKNMARFHPEKAVEHDPRELETIALPWRVTAILGGIVLAILLSLLPAPEGLNDRAWIVCSLAVLMVIWWVTEAVPLPVTSLLPIIVLPLLDVMPIKPLAASYMNPVIFLFMGGFMLSAAMQKWQLHRRFAYGVLRHVGNTPGGMVAGVLAVSSFLAMWISNTATAVMMLPIGLSLVTLLHQKGSAGSDAEKRMGKAISLAVAYGAVIGGLSTFVGTPTNAILYGHMQNTYNYSLELGRWMTFGIPLTFTIGFFAWLILRFLHLRGVSMPKTMRMDLARAYKELGKMKKGECFTALIFVIVVLLWISSAFLQRVTGLTLEDPAIAIFGALLLFLVPFDTQKFQTALEWKDVERIPWGILIFFGGSLSMSTALADTGVTVWLSDQLAALQGIHPVFIIFIVVAIVIIASELMSNVATITAFLPILSALSVALSINPMMVLIPATLAASCGFMLPGASAPNALAYSTGYLRVKEIVRAGFLLDIISALLIVFFSLTLMQWVMGENLYAIPQWAL